MVGPERDRDETFMLMRQIVEEHARVGERWCRDRGLSLMQAYILGYLVKNPGSIQRDVARTMGRGEANASAMLQRLESRGLVERRSDPSSDRTKLSSATAEGAALVHGLDAAMGAVDRAFLARLDAKDQNTLRDLLRTLRDGHNQD